jgi:3-hydroxyisobutyrate dehydrogenase-like beta-hydroxyacid dehydrogenase
MKDEMISLLARPSAPTAASSHGQGTIGFVGLGHMGTAMAANLAASGRPVTCYVRRPDQMGALIGLGLRPTLEFANLFDCGVVISMLPDDAAVRDVVLGREEAKGLASGLKDGAIHLSMSTISTATASRLAAEHARYGQSYVAAPVFGNPDAARVSQSYTAGFVLPLVLKDVRLALAEAERAAAPMPSVDVVRDRLITGIARGYADLDWSALGLIAAQEAGLNVPSPVAPH